MLKILPDHPTPEAALTAWVADSVDDPALYATRAVSLVRQVSRLQARSQTGQATSRRDSLYGVRLHQACQMLAPFSLTVVVLPDGVGIGTVEAAQSPFPAWLWKVEP